MSHTIVCMATDSGGSTMVCREAGRVTTLEMRENTMGSQSLKKQALNPGAATIMSWLLLANAAAFAASPRVAQAQGLPDPLPGTLSGTYAVNATSGSAVFTGNSTLEGTVTLDMRFLADYLVVGGGGGGGPSSLASPGGGGGGGRVIFDNAFVITTPQTFTIEVGAGGQGGIGGDLTTGTAATSGGQSRFGNVIAAGGGRGGWGGVGATEGNGAAGGSGGGAGRNSSLLTSGGTATGSLGLGSAGGTVTSSASGWGGAGGGGATAAGSAPPGTGSGGGNGGNGGQGYSSAILGTADVFGSGGGGGARGAGTPLVIATNGAGGTNAGSGGGPGGSGVANRGGGGGGGQRTPISPSPGDGIDGGAGGTGIVVVRYQGDPVTGSSGGVAGTGSAAGYTLHEYTQVGQTSLDMSGLNLDQRLAATLFGDLSGTGSLAYAGPGRLTLTGSNSYSGSTAVTAGTLVVNGTLSNTSLVTVGAAGTLGGTGLIAAGVTAAGVVAPGNSIGTLATNDFSLSGTLAVELARFNDGSSILPVSDLVDVTGSVTLTDADLSLGLWAGSGYSAPILGDIFYLIANDGADSISGVFTSLNGSPATLAEGSQFSWNSQQWKITYQANYTGSYESSSFTGGNDAAIIVVPEPTTLAGAVTGFAVLAVFIRRSRRRSHCSASYQFV